MRLFFLVAVLSITIALGQETVARGASYVDNLLEKAGGLKLSEQRYWHLLLQYRSGKWGEKSVVDNPRFFLSNMGQTDSAAEVAATIKAFFTASDSGQSPARCRFPARYAWLKTQLQFDESRLPQVNCPDLERALADIQPRSATLIFAAADINRPASMFGHTFLRINKKDRNPLLSTAINYAAITDGSMGFTYALKGIFGRFPGAFYLSPYHEKIREYAAIEHRDIWEYQLNLSMEEINRILLYIWEMRAIHSPYYFFHENCTFAMLYLLEIARPSLQLIPKTNPLWVLPVSALQSLVDSDVVTQVNYRPALGTNIRNMAARLPTRDVQLAHEIATGERAPVQLSNRGLSAQHQETILGLASEYLRYLADRHLIRQDTFLNRFQAISAENTKNVSVSSLPLLSQKPPFPPEEGHRPGRIDLGAGCTRDACFSEIGLRPLYHDFLDSDDGYTPHTTMNFMHLTLRHDFKRKALKLDKLQLVDMVSLVPRSAFFKPLSWKLRLGYERKYLTNARKKHVASAIFGGGTAISSSGALFYLLLTTELNFNKSLKNNAALGAGGAVGMLVTPIRGWRIRLTLNSILPVLGDRYEHLGGKMTHSFAVNRRNRLATIFKRVQTRKVTFSEITALWMFYF